MKRTSSGRPAHRPALINGEGEESTPVNVRVSTKTYEAVHTIHVRDRVSVPAVVRRALRKYLEDEDDD